MTLVAVLLLLFVGQGLYRNWGQKTFDALPANIDEASEWAGKDHDKVWYTRWVKYVKGWFAFGPYSNYGWARWRMTPITLFVKGGDKGVWRYENDSIDAGFSDGLAKALPRDIGLWYLSRIQYWKRWHLAVQWPLQVTFHFYRNSSDVPTYPNRPTGNEKMFFAYGPTHRDADKVYWLFGFFAGGCWK